MTLARMTESAAEVRALPQGSGVAGRLEALLAKADQDEVYAAVCVALTSGIAETRRSRGLSQQGLAEMIGSSQPRVSMMESADPGVSVSLMIRTLVRLGARRRDIARMLVA